MSLRKKPLNTVYQLEKLFKDSNQNPTREQKEQLTLSTGMSTSQINKWFQNRRNRKTNNNRRKDKQNNKMFQPLKNKVLNWNPKNERYWTEADNLKLLRLI